MNNYDEHGFLIISMQFFANRNISKMNSLQLRKSIVSWSEQIQLHKDKVLFPEKFYENWNDFDERYKIGLIKHWKHEIQVLGNDIREAEAELKKRGE